MSGISENEVTSNHASRVWTPLFTFIVMVALLLFMASQGLNAGASVYLVHKGYTAFAAGVSAAVFSISAAVLRIIVGQALDRRGRYLVVVAGALVTIASTLACLPQLDVVPFMVMRGFQGVGFAMVTTTSATMASDILPAERLGEGLGFYNLSQAIATSIGPGLALYLVGTDPAENLFIAMALISAGALLFGLLCTYEKHPEKLPASCGYRARLNNRIEEEKQPSVQNSSSGILERIFEPCALCGALPTLTIAPTMGFCVYFVGLYATEMGLTVGGLFFTLSAVAMIIVRLGSRLFMDRVAPIRILGCGIALNMVSMILLLLITQQGPSTGAAGLSSTVLFCLSGFLYGLGVGLSSPINQAVAVKSTPPERWGAANALVLLALDVGVGVASIVWGFVRDMWGFSAVIIGCMALLVVAFLFGLRLYPRGNDGGKRVPTR